jgi:hypothetical protein
LAITVAATAAVQPANAPTQRMPLPLVEDFVTVLIGTMKASVLLE